MRCRVLCLWSGSLADGLAHAGVSVTSGASTTAARALLQGYERPRIFMLNTSPTRIACFGGEGGHAAMAEGRHSHSLL